MVNGAEGESRLISERKELDIQVTETDAIVAVTSNLGLKGEGTHFFCPGCQVQGNGTPEMVIKSGGFYCFRCGAQGDVVGLVKLARGCDLDTAMAWLESEAAKKH